ncbi:MAG: hypothetical protein QM737_09430 [Ferruginibacter sp.]
MKMNAGIWIGIIAGLAGMIIGVTCVLLFAGSIGIYIAAGMVVMFGSIGLLLYKFLFQEMILASRLSKTGKPGKAIIKNVYDTNVTVNNQPQVKLVLELKNSLGQTYIANVRTLVSRIRPDIYRPGMTVRVLIDPNNENKMVIDDTPSAP